MDRDLRASGGGASREGQREAPAFQTQAGLVIIPAPDLGVVRASLAQCETRLSCLCSDWLQLSRSFPRTLGDGLCEAALSLASQGRAPSHCTCLPLH